MRLSTASASGGWLRGFAPGNAKEGFGCRIVNRGTHVSRFFLRGLQSLGQRAKRSRIAVAAGVSR